LTINSVWRSSKRRRVVSEGDYRQTHELAREFIDRCPASSGSLEKQILDELPE
jgi:hypothetical protein